MIMFSGNAIHRVRIAGFANAHNLSILDADVAFYNAPMVNHNHAGNHKVQHAFIAFAVADCAMPSRMVLPPPNFVSSPYTVKSFLLQ
jgi:hypothetical protein